MWVNACCMLSQIKNSWEALSNECKEKASAIDGMDIDSPSYAHHDNQKHSLSSDDQPSSELNFGQQSTQSTVQSRTGKGCFSGKYEEIQE
ncbi:hypothetical protein O181_012695 [Austropuccinia psidii MF-1]|uniref:Uncharacterized protein n=1 Tax=Austropuccinia psidii MF-1 TaxID=1389203 RepID=A0A9Q3BYG5_9BASI|nr:hypothetical protein [Austropuccinia psidii MF-1]